MFVFVFVLVPQPVLGTERSIASFQQSLNLMAMLKSAKKIIPLTATKLLC